MKKVFLFLLAMMISISSFATLPSVAVQISEGVATQLSATDDGPTWRSIEVSGKGTVECSLTNDSWSVRYTEIEILDANETVVANLGDGDSYVSGTPVSFDVEEGKYYVKGIAVYAGSWFTWNFTAAPSAPVQTGSGTWGDPYSIFEGAPFVGTKFYALNVTEASDVTVEFDGTVTGAAVYDATDDFVPAVGTFADGVLTVKNLAAGSYLIQAGTGSNGTFKTITIAAATVEPETPAVGTVENPLEVTASQNTFTTTGEGNWDYFYVTFTPEAAGELKIEANSTFYLCSDLSETYSQGYESKSQDDMTWSNYFTWSSINVDSYTWKVYTGVGTTFKFTFPTKEVTPIEKTQVELTSSEFTAEGGKLTFAEDVYVEYPLTVKVAGAKTKNIACQASLEQDANYWNVVNVTFSETLEAGDYVLQIPTGKIWAEADANRVVSGDFAFTVEETAPVQTGSGTWGDPYSMFEGAPFVGTKFYALNVTEASDVTVEFDGTVTGAAVYDATNEYADAVGTFANGVLTVKNLAAGSYLIMAGTGSNGTFKTITIAAATVEPEPETPAVGTAENPLEVTATNNTFTTTGEGNWDYFYVTFTPEAAGELKIEANSTFYLCSDLSETYTQGYESKSQEDLTWSNYFTWSSINVDSYTWKIYTGVGTTFKFTFPTKEITPIEKEQIELTSSVFTATGATLTFAEDVYVEYPLTVNVVGAMYKNIACKAQLEQDANNWNVVNVTFVDGDPLEATTLAAGDYVLQIPAGKIWAEADADRVVSGDFAFTVEGDPYVGPGLTLTLAELNANGGKLTFSENVAFAPNGEEQIESIHCKVVGSLTKNIVAQATLSVNWDHWNVLDVTFSEELVCGTYVLQIPADKIIANDTENVFAGENIEFTVTDGPVEITPENNVFVMPGETDWQTAVVKFTTPVAGELKLVSNSNFVILYAGGEYEANYAGAEVTEGAYTYTWNVLADEEYTWTMKMWAGSAVTFNFPEAEEFVFELQSSYPTAGTKVTEVPNKVLLMFNAEIYSVEAAAFKNEGDDYQFVEIPEEYVSVQDGNTVVVDLESAGLTGSLLPGNITIAVQVNGIEDAFETNFVLGAEFGVVSSEFTANGGQIIFNERVDFVDAEKVTCYVVGKEFKNIAGQATLSLDEKNFSAVNVAFDEALEPGEYVLQLSGLVMSISEEQFYGDVEFTVEGDPYVGPGLTLTLAELNANGGKLTFSENVAFAPNGVEATESVTCKVVGKYTKNIATQATLSYGEEWNVLNVSFADELEAGDYVLQIPANVIIANDTENVFAGADIDFSVIVEPDVEIPASATEIDLSYGAKTLSSVVDETNPDWYKFEVVAPSNARSAVESAEQEVHVTMNFSIANNFYANYTKIYIYNEAGFLQAKLEETIGNVEFDAVPGTYYMQVCYAVGVTLNAIDVEVSTSAIESISTANAVAGKMVVNGRVVIVKNGVKFNVAGQVTK